MFLCFLPCALKKVDCSHQLVNKEPVVEFILWYSPQPVNSIHRYLFEFSLQIRLNLCLEALIIYLDVFKYVELSNHLKLLQVEHFLKTSHVFRILIRCVSLVLAPSGYGPKSITLIRYLPSILKILPQFIIDSKLLLHI